jgi:Peptidase_C39 like family
MKSRYILTVILILRLQFSFSQKLELNNSIQISPNSCWAASIEMAVKYLQPNIKISQLDIIKKITPNCDTIDDVRRVKNRIFLDDCKKCQCRLPAIDPLNFENDVNRDMSIIDSLLLLYNCRANIYSDKQKFLEIVKNAIDLKKPIISFDSQSQHIFVIYGYKYLKNKKYLYINDPYGVQKTSKSCKIYWQPYSAFVDFNKKGNNNTTYRPFLKNKTNYELTRILTVDMISAPGVGL